MGTGATCGAFAAAGCAGTLGRGLRLAAADGVDLAAFDAATAALAARAGAATGAGVVVGGNCMAATVSRISSAGGVKWRPSEIPRRRWPLLVVTSPRARLAAAPRARFAGEAGLVAGAVVAAGLRAAGLRVADLAGTGLAGVVASGTAAVGAGAVSMPASAASDKEVDFGIRCFAFGLVAAEVERDGLTALPDVALTDAAEVPAAFLPMGEILSICVPTPLDEARVARAAGTAVVIN